MQVFFIEMFGSLFFAEEKLRAISQKPHNYVKTINTNTKINVPKMLFSGKLERGGVTVFLTSSSKREYYKRQGCGSGYVEW